MDKISFDFLSVHRKSCCVISKMKNPHHKISLKLREGKIHAAIRKYSWIMVTKNWLNDSVALKKNITIFTFSLSLSVFLFKWETSEHFTCLPFSPQPNPLTIVKHKILVLAAQLLDRWTTDRGMEHWRLCVVYPRIIYQILELSKVY